MTREEILEVYEAGPDAVVSLVQALIANFEAQVQALNERVRPSRGGFTAAQLDRMLPRAEDLVSRDRFYEAACEAQRSAAQGVHNVRARRRAERETIYFTMEVFGLVKRTRGGRPLLGPNSEGER